MKLIGLVLFSVNPAKPEKDAILLVDAWDLSDAPLLYRSKAKELAIFQTRTIAGFVQPLSRSQVEDKKTGFMINAESSTGGRLVVVAVTDRDYPSRIAFDLTRRVSSMFTDGFRGKWETAEKDNAVKWPELESIRREAAQGKHDQIHKINEQLEQTKITMLGAIDEVLIRGEKIDDLVGRSEALSAGAKDLHETSKKMNGCCN